MVFCRGTQILGTKLSWQLNAVWWSLVSVDPQYVTCFMSWVWFYNFYVAPKFFLQNLCTHYVLVPSKHWVHQMATVCHFTFSKPQHPQHTLKNKHEKPILCAGQQFCIWSIVVQRSSFHSHYCSPMRLDSEMTTDVTKYTEVLKTHLYYILNTEMTVNNEIQSTKTTDAQ